MNAIHRFCFTLLTVASAQIDAAYAQRFFPVVFNQLPRDMQMYARDNDSFAEVPFSGKIEVNGYDHMSVITYRNNERKGYSKAILNYGGGATSGFAMTAMIKAEMADYSFEVFACNEHDSVKVVTRVDVAAGDFYVINGQSNASAIIFGGWGGSKYCRTLARTPDNNPSLTAADTLWIPSAWSWPYVGAWGLQLQRKILETNGIPTCVINGSLPGSKIAWHAQRNGLEPTSPGLYGFLLSRVKIANPTKIKAFLWYQGEQEVLEDIRNYSEDYDRLFNFWLEDYPMVEKFVVLQITVLFNPFYVAGTIRDFQRRTKYLYPRTDHFSTMGLPYFDGIHYSIAGYQELGERLFNFLSPGVYSPGPVAHAVCPDVRKVFYSSSLKDEVTLVYEEGQQLAWPNDTLIEDVTYNFFTKGLREVFYFDGDENEAKPPVVKSGAADGNRVKLTLFASSAATKLNYLPAYKGEKIRIYYGPYLRNAGGLGAFSFQNVDIYDALPVSNLSASETDLGKVLLSWTGIPAASYVLSRKAEGESSFTKVQEMTGPALSFTDVSVLPGHLYQYRLLAVTDFSESPPSETSLRTSSVLPVTLVRFDALRLGVNTVKLNWQTTSELNNMQFEIQRSYDPKSGFVVLGTVDGAGNSGVTKNYEFEDVFSTGLAYYRLKQIDFDGSFVYSRIVSVQPFGGSLEVISFPNPSSQGKVQFKVLGLDSPEAISVLVYDSRGIVLYKNERYLLDSQFLISLDAFPRRYKGRFLIKIEARGRTVSASFVSF